MVKQHPLILLLLKIREEGFSDRQPIHGKIRPIYYRQTSKTTNYFSNKDHYVRKSVAKETDGQTSKIDSIIIRLIPQGTVENNLGAGPVQRL